MTVLAASPLAVSPLTAPDTSTPTGPHDYNLPLELTVRAGGSLTVEPNTRGLSVDG